MPREGILIEKPLERLSREQVQQIHDASIEILIDPGLLCFNKKAAEIFNSNGAEVDEVIGSNIPCWHVKIPEKLVTDAIESAPSTVTLGARNPDNTLILYCICSP